MTWFSSWYLTVRTACSYSKYNGVVLTIVSFLSSHTKSNRIMCQFLALRAFNYFNSYRDLLRNRDDQKEQKFFFLQLKPKQKRSILLLISIMKKDSLRSITRTFSDTSDMNYEICIEVTYFFSTMIQIPNLFNYWLTELWRFLFVLPENKILAEYDSDWDKSQPCCCNISESKRFLRITCNTDFLSFAMD